MEGLSKISWKPVEWRKLIHSGGDEYNRRIDRRGHKNTKDKSKFKLKNRKAPDKTRMTCAMLKGASIAGMFSKIFRNIAYMDQIC